MSSLHIWVCNGRDTPEADRNLRKTSSVSHAQPYSLLKQANFLRTEYLRVSGHDCFYLRVSW